MTRRLLAPLGFVLALVCAFPAWVQLQRGEGAELDDADLRSERPRVPEAENAFPLLVEAAAKVVWLDEAEAERWQASWAEPAAWDPALAAALLERNRTALAALPAVLRRSRFESTPFRRLADDLPEMLPWRWLNEVVAVRAVEHARAGRRREALDDLLIPIRLGQIVQGDTRGVLIHAMIGVTLQEVGLRAFDAALPHLELDRAEAREIAAQLAALRSDPEVWAAMWSAEYRVMIDSYHDADSLAMMGLDEIASSEQRAELADLLELGAGGRWLLERLPSDYLYRPQDVWARYAELMRARRASADAPCAAQPELPRTRVGIARLLVPNALGEELMRDGAETVREFTRRRCETDTRLVATGVRLALLAFEAERAALPETLDELAPDWLPPLPREGSEIDPLRYDRAQRMLRDTALPQAPLSRESRAAAGNARSSPSASPSA